MWTSKWQAWSSNHPHRAFLHYIRINFTTKFVLLFNLELVIEHSLFFFYPFSFWIKDPHLKTMIQKSVKQRNMQQFSFTIFILCVLQVSSFAFNPLRIINVNHNRGSKIGIRSLNENFLTKFSPLKISQSSDIHPKSGKAVPFLNIANVLTISRVFAIPFFMLSFVMRKVYLSIWPLSLYSTKIPQTQLISR